MDDVITRSLMEKISISVDKELDASFPSQRAARVAITGRGRSEEHLQPTRVGDPDAPLSDAQLDAKYLELAVPVIGEGKAKALLQKLWKLESEKSLAP
jgi:2-methylcitrate dehydratase PrpD